MAHGFTHVLVGGAAAALVWQATGPPGGEPTANWLAEPQGWTVLAGASAVALASHLLLDLMPHYDYLFASWQEVLLSLLALAACFFLPPAPASWVVLLGGFWGVVPDLEHGPYWRGWMRRRFFPTHSGWLPHRKCGPPASLLSQALLNALALLIIGGV
ncbi:MAG TPA: hypothetical protein EYP85_09305 [Armatimonadetes bacterium]|nr:hypothetical protein [Armatimonadota bacterium]